MAYTNERFFDVTDAEFRRQSRLLQPLQDRHAAELYAAGTLERVIGSTALSNRFANKDSLSEGTEVTPFRTDVQYQRLPLVVDMLRDTGLVTEADPTAGFIHSATLLTTLQGPLYALGLHRVETSPGQTDASGYFAGLQLDHATQASLELDSNYAPAPGVTVADLVLIDRQLHEVGAFAEQHELTIVDPMSLAIGPGAIMEQ